jgi:hypothetical protein
VTANPQRDRPEQAYYESLSRYERRKLRYIQFIAVLAVLTVLLQPVLALIGRHQILDCTTPGGECFDRGARRTAEVVTGLQGEHHQIEHKLRRLQESVDELRMEIRHDQEKGN